jgi:hypothetical protein
MHRIFCFALAIAVAFAPVIGRSQAPSPDRDKARTATRCATLYLLMSRRQSPEQAVYFDAMVDAMGARAQTLGASGTDIDVWAKELLADLDAAGDPGSTFVTEQGDICRTLANELTLATTGTPEGGEGHVASRHPDGQPATIVVQQNTVAFDTGAGTSCEAPVVMTQAADRGARIRAQYVWLADMHSGWTSTEHATRYSETPSEENIDRVHVYSWHKLEREGLPPAEVCFDMTADGVAELKALAQ